MTEPTLIETIHTTMTVGALDAAPIRRLNGSMNTGSAGSTNQESRQPCGMELWFVVSGVRNNATISHESRNHGFIFNCIMSCL